jgi:hypothetical protein
MSASALLKSRVARPSYLKKLAKAEDLIEHFPHDSWIVSRSSYTIFFHPMDLMTLEMSCPTSPGRSASFLADVVADH